MFNSLILFQENRHTRRSDSFALIDTNQIVVRGQAQVALVQTGREKTRGSGRFLGWPADLRVFVIEGGSFAFLRRRGMATNLVEEERPVVAAQDAFEGHSILAGAPHGHLTGDLTIRIGKSENDVQLPIGERLFQIETTDLVETENVHRDQMCPTIDPPNGLDLLPDGAHGLGKVQFQRRLISNDEQARSRSHEEKRRFADEEIRHTYQRSIAVVEMIGLRDRHFARNAIEWTGLLDERLKTIEIRLNVQISNAVVRAND